MTYDCRHYISVCYGTMATKTKQSQNTQSFETKNVLKAPGIKKGKRLTIPPNQPYHIDWGAMATENLEDFTFEVEVSNVGLSLTWTTRCGCLLSRDKFRLRMFFGLLFMCGRGDSNGRLSVSV